MNISKGLLIPTLLALLSACGGGGGGSSAEASKVNTPVAEDNGAVVIAKRMIQADETCTNGGIEVDMGIDNNTNGQLDPEEVTSTETVCHGQSSLVSLTPSTDVSCQYGGTNINVGMDLNGNAALEPNEITNTTLICHAQSSVIADDFSLSNKGILSGQLDLALIPTPRTMSASSTVQPFVVTSQAGSLWLTPNDITSAIQADRTAEQQAKDSAGSDTQLTPPLVTPIEISVAEDGSYNIEIPAGTDYSLNYVSEDGTEGVKIEGVNISPNQSTDVNVSTDDLEETGSVEFVVQSLANNSVIEGATVTLLNDATGTLTDATGAASFEGLPEGSYSLLVEHDGFVSQTFPAQVRSGESINLGVIQLNNQKGSASGSLTVDTQLLTSLENIVVYARDQRGGIYTTLTDGAGAFSFSALPVASGYSFIAQANDFSADKIENITITAATNTDVGSVQLNPASAFVGAISGFAKFSDNADTLNAHAGLLVAVEGTDKEAVTSRDGAFVLNGLLPGRYTLNFTDSNYQTTTLENIRVVATATTALDPVKLQLKTGQVSGIVSLEGQLNSAGVLVEILGSSNKTYTDNSGRWYLNLPTGNYGSGIRYSANLFETKTVNETISVIENGEYQAGAQVLAQMGKNLSFDLSASGGSCSSLDVSLVGISGAATGYNGNFTIENGTLEQDLVFGDYTLTASCADAGFETVVKSITLEAGTGLMTTLEPIALRVSFVTVNQGALYTNDLNVTLDIGAVGATEMQIIQGAFDSGWIALADSYALALEAGDGNKTVLIHLRDDQQQPLSDVSASINLDTTITVASFTATGATTKNDVLHVRLDLSAETGADATVTIPGLINGLVLFDNGLNGDVTANDGIYERNLDISTPNELTATITANITDRAGNTLSQDAATNLVLSTDPSISAVSISSNVASGEMTIRFSTDEPATSAINYGADEAVLNTNLPIEALLTQNHTIILSGLPANQLTYFQLVATDAASNVGDFNGQGKLAPAPTEGLNAAAGSAEVGLVWKASTHNELAGYNVYRSADGGSSFSLLNTNGVISEHYLVDSSATNETAYQYYITVVDLDGNESIASASIDVTPSLSFAGPTEMNGGVIATDTIWLSSRSPYNITNNMLIREEGSLLLMAGTHVELQGESDRHIRVKGNLQAYGEKADLVVIQGNAVLQSNDTRDFYNGIYYSGVQRNLLRYVEFNNIFSDGGDLVVENSIINQLVPMSFRARVIRDSQIKGADDCRNPTSVVVSEGIYNTSIDGGENSCIFASGVNLHEVSAQGVNFSENFRDILDSSFVDVSFERPSLTIKGSSFVNSSFASGRILKMHKSRLDINTRFGLISQLDISANYWGTADVSVISEMTGYIPDQDRSTHLYPIITSADLENADWDNDGIPDIRDHDNDNDGYSDLQEDWSSDPAYGSIYNPLDADSHPSDAIDTDMDGMADAVDTDDDNDNLSDADEAVYGTNPLLADSDNDGSLDGDEISRKYDPLDGTNFPYIGSISGINIDSSNVNADGWVFFAGDAVVLNSVTVSPDVKLMVDRDTSLTFNNSSLIGNKNNPIFIRSSGTGNGTLSLNESRMEYSNVKLGFSLKGNNAEINNSDLSASTYSSLRGLVSNSILFGLGSHMNADLVHVYAPNVSGAYLNGDVNYSLVTGRAALSGSVFRSVLDELQDFYKGANITESIIYKYDYQGDIKNSDIQLVAGNKTWASAFFNGSYIRSQNSSVFYDGIGAPVDTIGDGVAETAFTLGGHTYTVDGIKNPRSTPNFPNGESDLWDPNGVGVLWDKNDPNTFPDPLGL